MKEFILHYIKLYKYAALRKYRPLLLSPAGRRPWSGDYKMPSVCPPICPSVRHVFA